VSNIRSLDDYRRRKKEEGETLAQKIAKALKKFGKFKRGEDK